MKYLLLLLVIPVLAATECGKKKKTDKVTDEKTQIVGTTLDSLPVCVQKLIFDGSKEDPPSAPVEIEEYIYQGKKVYLAKAPCCDFYDLLYDENCKELCAPTGGFTGRGDGKCPDFIKEAKLVRSVWKEKMK